MNSDIRIATNCPDHPKIKKLMRRLGDGAFWNLVRFWCFVATNKPTGDITCYDIDDIEIGSGWDGENGLFFSTLLELNLITKDNSSVVVRDWERHNSWAFGAEARSNKARAAAKVRWDNKNNARSIATSIELALPQAQSSNAPLLSSPILKKKSIVGQKPPRQEIPYSLIIDFLNSTSGRSYKSETASTKKFIKARWNEGFRVDEFKAVITSKVNEWNGDDSKKLYIRPETLFGTKFESYLSASKGNGKVKNCGSCQSFCLHGTPDKCNINGGNNACSDYL